MLIKIPRGGKSFGPKNIVLWKSLPWHWPRCKAHITKSPHLHHHQFLLLPGWWRASLLLSAFAAAKFFLPYNFSPCSNHSDLWKPKSIWLSSVPKIKSSCPVGAGKALHRLAPLIFWASSYANFHDKYTPATLLSLLPPEHQTYQAISQLRAFAPRTHIPCSYPALAPLCLKFVCPFCRGAFSAPLAQSSVCPPPYNFSH